VRSPVEHNFPEQGVHTTRVPEEGIARMLQHVRELAEEPDEVERVEPRLRAALRESIV
jgi:hypothetical protein